MALRRSNRRITITGSSVFSASTPMVPPPILETASSNNENASPQWVSAEEAFGNLKTPKFPKMTRRTTMTRQNIFDDESVIVTAAADTSGFKAPRFFIPVSPPGVKTRSRRSSIMMGPPKQIKAKKIGNVTGGKKTNPNIVKTDTKVTQKATSKRRSEVKPVSNVSDLEIASTNISSRKSVLKGAIDGGDTEFTSIERLSPIIDAEIKIDMKKPRRSIRHQHMESEETVVASQSIAFMNDFQTPRTHVSQGVEQRHENDTKLRRSMIAETPKASSTFSQSTRTAQKTPKMETTNDSGDTDNVSDLTVKSRATLSKTPLAESRLAKSPSRSIGVKRRMSVEENDEIEHVVKKMFSPAKFYSSKDLSYKQKLKSPNTGKASSSPARTAIMRDAVDTGRKSPARKALETNDAPNTPSRAASKARKVLGVSINSAPFNNNTQNRTKQSIEVNERLSIDEAALSTSEAEDVSYREDENNVTLSHTSHSQWCTIL